MKTVPVLSYGADTGSVPMRLQAALLRRLPPRWRRPARRLMYLPADLLDTVLRRREELVPPRGLLGVGAGDYRATGEQFLEFLREHCGLVPDSRVLDFGCGIGRMAVPLTRFLEGGTYDGIDVSAADMRWCQRHIGRKVPNFSFHTSAVHHREYNPGGTLRAVDDRLPFADGSFDVVLASSLFTHLLSAETEHYLGEVSRVLAANGKAFVSFFLLNDESRALIAAEACGFRFETSAGEAHLHDVRNPEGAVAYDEAFIREVFRYHGLTVKEPLLYGCWCCRERFTSYQDIVVATHG
ncbi:MAG: class I SAM-dependent methyltransferase [Thermoanaerobaculia bacterium]